MPVKVEPFLRMTVISPGLVGKLRRQSLPPVAVLVELLVEPVDFGGANFFAVSFVALFALVLQAEPALGLAGGHPPLQRMGRADAARSKLSKKALMRFPKFFILPLHCL